MGVVLAAECERARKRASLGLDGELSQVEQALLRAHVGRCAQCAGFAHDLGAMTQGIRATPLTRPRLTGMPARRRSSGMRPLQLVAAAAAVIVAAGLGGLVGSLSSGPTAHRSASLLSSPKALRSATPSAFRSPRLPGTRLQQSAPV
jgi:predicted anti-sigma-YlaC factor YlaD